MRLAPITALAVGGALLAGCGAVPPAPTDAPSPAGPLVAAGPMPAAPPDVLVQGVEVAPLTSHWIIGGTVQQSGPTSPEDIASLSIAEVPAPGGGWATIEILHPTVPPTIYVTVFERLDENGHPDGAGRRADCSPTSAACLLRRGEDRLRLQVRADAWARLLVLQVAYTVWPADAAGVPGAPDLVTASWGACLVPAEELEVTGS
jgi:hypothetical protein